MSNSPANSKPQPPRRIESLAQLPDVVRYFAENPKCKALRLELPVDMPEMLQARVELDEPTIVEYGEARERGDTFPPNKGILDKTAAAVYCFDGEHRLEAIKRRGGAFVEFELRLGSREDAVIAAAGANTRHGRPRNQQDKRRAVRMLLELDTCRGLSSNRLAALAGVSPPTVETVREELDREAIARGELPALSGTRKALRGGREYTVTAKRRTNHVDNAAKTAGRILARVIRSAEKLDADARNNLAEQLWTHLVEGAGVKGGAIEGAKDE